MAIWDNVTDIFSGGGRSDINRGYDQADQYLDPYRRGGIEDYNHMRDYSNKWGDQLGQYGNAGDWMYKQINQSPVDYYNSIMKGYSESPEAKYEQEQALRASNAGASASGMMGSGAFMKGLQENAAGISNRDRDRYYGNVMNANNAQMGYLQNLQGQQAQQRAMMQYLTQLGYGAAGTMGNNAIDRGNAMAGLDRQTIMDLMSLFGMGKGGAFSSGGASGGGMSGGGMPMPMPMPV